MALKLWQPEFIHAFYQSVILKISLYPVEDTLHLICVPLNLIVAERVCVAQQNGVGRLQVLLELNDKQPTLRLAACL